MHETEMQLAGLRVAIDIPEVASIATVFCSYSMCSCLCCASLLIQQRIVGKVVGWLLRSKLAQCRLVCCTDAHPTCAHMTTELQIRFFHGS